MTATIAQVIDQDPLWVVAALPAQHALTTEEAEIIGVLALDSGTGSHRQNSEDSDAGYPEAGCGDDGDNDGCSGRLTFWEGHGSRAYQFLQPALEAGPPNDWPGSASSWSAPDQLPCHAAPPAFLHELVSERKTRTGRNPKSI
ncbi:MULTISPECIES: hypothetical protein [unclassified Arthrobacter]|uniref:hypothetical protein n=1 Tax=unclassified Arthrobacter TaxID=235627 RepID=UPI001CFF7753|nr:MULTISPECIES: hypothetical protein [unclassified Arthrobacter]WGZ80668.1 hypothetical protein QI450_05595 [Arthrobacter sp. EM1]